MIKVNIECTSGDSDLPEDLEYLEDEQTDWREGYIMVNNIVCFYPDKERKYTYIDTIKSTITVKDSMSEIEILIQQANKYSNYLRNPH